MSIIDKIYDIEASLEEIEKQISTKTIQLQEQAQEKKSAIKTMLNDEFNQYKHQQEALLIEKIDKYEQELFQGLDAKKQLLEQHINQKKEIIFKNALEIFWEI